MAMAGEMASLPARTPSEAVQAFLRQMAEHHSGAIGMGDTAVAKATHQELGDQAWTMVAGAGTRSSSPPS